MIKHRKIIYVVLSILLLPFFVNHIYNAPTADDYWYANYVSELGFIGTQLYYYFKWSGRYISTLFLTVNPLVFNSYKTYGIASFIYNISLILSLLYFFKVLFHKYEIKLSAFLISLITYFIYISGAPNISEGFYWMAGYVNYGVPLMLSVLSFGIYLDKRFSSFWRIFLVSLLNILSVGCNETWMLLTLYTQFAFLTLGYIKHKKVDKELLIIFLITSVAGAIALFAPGNTVRAQRFPKKHLFIRTISNSILYSIVYSFRFLKLQFLLTLILFTPEISKLPIFNFSNKKDIKLVLIFNFFFMFLLFLPALWSIGNKPPTRTINMGYFVFIFVFTFFYIINLQFYGDKFSKFIQKIKKNYKSIAFVCFVLLVSLTSVNTSYYDMLIIGPQYKTIIDKRYLDIESGSKNIITKDIRKLKTPSTFYRGDIHCYTQKQTPGDFGRYFKLESIRCE
ncbi:DUF6056 family protein [Acetoanaerobium sticklandii]|uniref:DUF6056 family protein n=1 Tax=Acetoanaerobium sticklandii TaxID=1511 RepID=UPI003A93BF3B